MFAYVPELRALFYNFFMMCVCVRVRVLMIELNKSTLLESLLTALSMSKEFNYLNELHSKAHVFMFHVVS